MFQTKSIFQEKNNHNPYLFINLVFAFFPISFVVGSLFVNLNLLLLCALGAYYLKSKILKIKFDFSMKIIFLFFIIIIFSTSLGFLKTLYFEGFNSIDVVPSCFSTNCYSPLEKLTKSVLFFRFFLLLLIIYLLSRHDILNFKYFFLSASLVAILVSLDVIYQYIFGFNIIGLKSGGYANSGFFRDEYIAGSFVQRFAFFSIPFAILIFKDKNYFKFTSIPIVICILFMGILFSGNKMPLVLFIFGLLLLFIFNPSIRKIFLIGGIVLFTFFQFIILSNERYKAYLVNTYDSFHGQVNTLRNITGIAKWNKTRRINEGESIQTKTSYYVAKHEGSHRRIFLTAIEVWKTNSFFEKIFGRGIKSFREDCWRFSGQSDGNYPDIYLGESLMPNKKNLLCANHPHNYYLEILTETGIVGLLIIFVIASLFIFFIIKNLKLTKNINIENFILLAAITSLILETLPLKSTGSLFSTMNATYLTLISTIILSHKTLIKNNNSK